jgi:hypothetical protein
MSNGDDDDEGSSILSWLFDAVFGRREASDEEIGGAIHRLGTLNRRSRDDD